MAKRLHGALINARYSTDNQNPDSIEVQVAKCTEWCHAHNIPVLGVYADEATSGMKDTRPRYAAMMRDLQDGVGDMVVIYDQSRLFRKMTSWFAFRDQLTQMGVEVVSVTQPMIGKDLRDPTNFLTEGSMALFNQIWALQSRQKVMEKMRFMAKNGQHTGGKPALGYEVVDGRLAICEAEAKIVRRIFKEYGSGKSYREIVAGLNADGIKTKRGSAFGANSLYDLLKNEKYIGTLVYGQRPYREDGTRNTHAEAADSIRIENAIPAIIDKELFAKVQDKMAANKRQQGGRPPTKRDYPLKGKVFCAECKSAMTISTSQKIYDYYKCSGKKRRHDCDGVNIPVDVLEKTVADAVRQVLGSPRNADRLITILREQSGEIQAQAVETLRQLIAREREISQKLDNATDAILGGLSSPTLLARVKDLEQEKTEINRQMRELKATVDASAIPETRLREIIDEISRDNPAGNAALLSIVCRVEVAKDTITIWTMLDTHPDGTFDWSEEGVLITPGITSGVPKTGHPMGDDPFLICQSELERAAAAEAAATNSPADCLLARGSVLCGRSLVYFREKKPLTYRPAKTIIIRCLEIREERKMYQKQKKMSPVLIAVLAAALLAVGIAVWFLLTHVWVAGSFYPRNAQVLDLRFADITGKDYDKLRKKSPDSEILWRIPFQGKTYDQNTDVLYVTSLTDEDVAALDYFTCLSSVEAQECTDYPQLAALAARRPEVTVDYAVTIDGRKFDQDTVVVSVSDITDEEIELLAYLPKLTAVTAVGCRTREQMEKLADFCEEKGLTFALRFGTKTYPNTVQELDITGITDEELELLQLLPELKTLHMVNPEADPEAVAQLRSAYPKVEITWEVEIAGVSFPDDTTEVDLSAVLESSVAAQTAAATTKTAAAANAATETETAEPAVTLDLQELEKRMAYLPDAEQVFLGKCGLDNEELAALRERNRESYKVVWTVQLGKKLTARTDDTTFMPVREHVYYFLDEDAYNLRYCEEMLCVDVGHMGLTNIDFVTGMPHLQYLILAHNGQLQDISPISSCKELIFLELDWSAVKDFTPLVGCTSLEDLNIGLTYPSVEPLMQMTWLKNLWMVDRGGGYQLSQALPDTKIVATANATVGAGWRNLPNYYAMRDMLGMEYMAG